MWSPGDQNVNSHQCSMGFLSFLIHLGIWPLFTIHSVKWIWDAASRCLAPHTASYTQGMSHNSVFSRHLLGSKGQLSRDFFLSGSINNWKCIHVYFRIKQTWIWFQVCYGINVQQEAYYLPPLSFFLIYKMTILKLNQVKLPYLLKSREVKYPWSHMVHPIPVSQDRVPE